ncbi:TPA: accessory Sec system protein Asp3 [Enterococcus faecium]
MRWPRNVSAVYVHGATLRYEKDNGVYYANEVLSPGQIICSWQSVSDYLSSGIIPSLPLLKVNKQYELDIKFKADNALPVQIQINFFDEQHEMIQSYSSTEYSFRFDTPSESAYYEVNLVNLKHHWIYFDYLSIAEVQEKNIVIEKHSRQNYEWIYVRTSERETSERVRLIVNRGPRSIVPVSLNLDTNDKQIFVYTNGQDMDKLIKSINNTLPHINAKQTIIEAGTGFYTLPSETVSKIKMEFLLN